MTYTQSKSIVVLFPTGVLTDDEILKVVSNIKSNFSAVYPLLKFSVGIGNCYDDIGRLKRSYEEAVKTIEIAKAVNEDGYVWFYKNMGFYSLLFYVDDELALRTYYKNVLEDLENYDMEKSTDMCKTLEVYIENNLSITKASEELFVHRNTMRYRIDRIQDILCVDLNDIGEVSKLSLAFAVKKYLDKMYSL